MVSAGSSGNAMCTSEDKIAAAIAGIRALGFAGAAITVPYKIVSIPHLDEADDDVRAIGAVKYNHIKNSAYWQTRWQGCRQGHTEGSTSKD